MVLKLHKVFIKYLLLIKPSYINLRRICRIILTLVNTKIVATKFGPGLGFFRVAESEYGVSFVGLALVLKFYSPSLYKIRYLGYEGQLFVVL